MHSFAELERHAFKMGGVSFGANLKLVWVIDGRVNRVVLCSSMFKSLCDDKDDA